MCLHLIDRTLSGSSCYFTSHFCDVGVMMLALPMILVVLQRLSSIYH
jgi:hypothetical protein